MSGQVTKTRILRVGLDLASAEGLCTITFGSVARRASLSKGGVVAHFPHLDDLKRSILMLHWTFGAVPASESTLGLEAGCRR
jgi:AcrR family transcriptional regulator